MVWSTENKNFFIIFKLLKFFCRSGVILLENCSVAFDEDGFKSRFSVSSLGGKGIRDVCLTRTLLSDSYFCEGSRLKHLCSPTLSWRLLAHCFPLINLKAVSQCRWERRERNQGSQQQPIEIPKDSSGPKKPDGCIVGFCSVEPGGARFYFPISRVRRSSAASSPGGCWPLPVPLLAGVVGMLPLPRFVMAGFLAITICF